MQYSFSGKRITVMGLGLHGGGVGTVKFLLREGAKEILVTDLKSKKELLASLRELPQSPRIRYVLGRHRLDDFRHRDAVIKNPDVPSSSPYLQYAKKYGVPIISDIGVFFERVQAPIIGVTGTKGKSTTATLIYLLLKARFRRVVLAGNIRTSVLQMMERAMRADAVVLELSSFQLEDLAYMGKSPHVAVITNIFPDHINRHGTFTKYRRVKSLISRFQRKGDTLVIPQKRGLEALIKRSHASKILVNLSEKNRKIMASTNPALCGHNADAALLAQAVAESFGMKPREINRALRRFKPLPGRLQLVAKKHGVAFINDTTATNPTAAALDLEHTASMYRHVVLIAGGSDKQLPLGYLANAIRKHSRYLVLLPGRGTEKLIHAIGEGGGMLLMSHASSMRQAVRQARLLAGPGDAVLLSPGAASFGLFRHEFHRGDEFIKAVNQIR